MEHGGGSVLTRCVAFDADSLSGDQVMSMSGIEYATATYGGLGKAVCQVDYEPTSYPPGCWTSTSPYWAMFVSRGGGAWAVSSRGISAQTFADGDALGWHYQPQSGPGGGPPPSPAGICVAAAPPPVATSPPPRPVTTAPPETPTPTTSEAPAAVATPTASPTTSPTVNPPAAPSPRPAGSSATTQAGWIVASAGAGVLGGLLLLQLVAPRIRR